LKKTNWSVSLSIVVVVVLLGLVWGVPRSVQPLEMPLPAYQENILQQIRAQERARAASLAASSEQQRGNSLFEIRAIGSLLRKMGVADAHGDRQEMAKLRMELFPLLQNARGSEGEQALLRLRDYQLGVFLSELHSWERDGKIRRELEEVGGNFIGLGQRNYWIISPHRLLPNDHVRAALFKRRFAALAGLKQQAFDLALEENRCLYAFLLSHPPPGGAGERLVAGPGQRKATWEWLLRKANEMARLDNGYPIGVARGVAYLALGDERSGVLALREHLAHHPQGPYALRARNYLAYGLRFNLSSSDP
jgi:hypothetical protein